MRKSNRNAVRSQGGIGAALGLLGAVRRGAFASQALRDLDLAPTDRTLAASLIYSCLRRLNLWEHLAFSYLKPRPGKFSPFVRDALTLGAAGILELRHFAPAVLVNGLVEWTKGQDRGGARVVNAVMRRLLEEGPVRLAQLEKDLSIESLALRCGVPLWVARRWQKDYGTDEARRLMALQNEPAALSLRLSPGIDPHQEAETLGQAGFDAVPSPLLSESLRLTSSALPTALPGYDEGRFTAQSESSMIVGREAAALLGEGRLLDMCAGRAVKAGGILQASKNLTLEGWDLSSSRITAGQAELDRLGVGGRAELRCGDGLQLEPQVQPDAVVVDAPCSASGTWRRHPEAKWRLTEEKLASLADLQLGLLRRACDLVKPGGAVLYATCSQMVDENQGVLKALLAQRPMEVEPLTACWSGSENGKDGTVLTPVTPWSDGFYLVRLRSRGH